MHWTGSVDPLASRPWVAVIGPRDATPALRRVAFRLAVRLAQTGRVVVSGLARGVDEAAHFGALRVPDGRTVAIVSTAPGEPVYPPAHARLAHTIVAHGGALGHPFATPAAAWIDRKRRLVERNLVIAEWVRGVYVVTDEQPITGGSRWAAAQARALGKPVVRVDSQGRFWPDPAIAPAVWTGPREARLAADLAGDP